MPFAEYQRSFRCHNHGQGGQRPTLAQRSGKMAGVVLALDWPAESETATGKARERALEVGIYTSAPSVEHRGGDREARGYEPFAFRPAPGFERMWIHLGRS